jgi:N-acetylglucosaminyl-diphospho-decaprenol L-rhamnosyltransferase
LRDQRANASARTSGDEESVPALDIAVVIVTYRSALLTIESLRSVQTERSSSGLRVRAIVVDNASGDLSAIEQAVRANDWQSWVTLVLAPKNGGFAYGNNLGIDRAYATGAPDYVYLLNPDAQVRAGAISALVRFLETHPEAGIAGSTFENLDGSEWPIAFRFPGALSTRLLRRWQVAQKMSNTAQAVDWICGASMLIRPVVFAAIGGLDERYFLYFEETDFCFRARRAGFATWYVPESRVMHIRGQSTTVTDETLGAKRLPSYWFESRRRYFVITSGMSQAMVIDIVALVTHSLGWLKRLVLRRMHTAVPYFIRDLARHSVLWPRNRHCPSIRHFSPPS